MEVQKALSKRKVVFLQGSEGTSMESLVGGQDPQNPHPTSPRFRRWGAIEAVDGGLRQLDLRAPGALPGALPGLALHHGALVHLSPPKLGGFLRSPAKSH